MQSCRSVRRPLVQRVLANKNKIKIFSGGLVLAAQGFPKLCTASFAYSGGRKAFSVTVRVEIIAASALGIDGIILLGPEDNF